jgi:hypothetical protein
MGGARPVFGSDAHMVAKVGANLHLALEAIREAGFDRFAPWTGVIRKNGPSYKAAQRIDMG